MGANEPETVTIFHLRRKDGQSVFLHPFDNSRRFIDLLWQVPIEGRYGKEPEVPSFTIFRSKLYRMIDDGLWNWVREVHGIPHSLASGAVFLSVYLVPAIVLRGRVPPWGAAVFAFGAALLAYFTLGHREMHSETVERRRQILRENVDRIYFRSDLFVLEVEHELARCDHRPPERVSDTCFDQPGMPFAFENDREARQLTACLEKRFDHGGVRRHPNRIPGFLPTSTARTGRGRRLVGRCLRRARPDPALYALYREVKKTIEASAENEGR